MSVLGDNKDNIFGERLKTLRNTVMNMTQKEFSELLGIPQPTLSAYESGRNKPSVDVLISLSDKCNVSIDWLCGKDNASHMSTLGDLAGMLFDLFNMKQISCKTEIQDRIDIEGDDRYDDKYRNWVKLTFYHCESKYDKEQVYSQDICQIIKKAYNLHNMLQDYDCSQEYYEKEKENFIKAYSDYPITLLDRSGMSEEERIAHRNEKLKAEWEAELKKKSEK